jgi:hypothetical protein
MQHPGSGVIPERWHSQRISIRIPASREATTGAKIQNNSLTQTAAEWAAMERSLSTSDLSRVFEFSKPKLFLRSLIGLMLPVTAFGAIHFALRADWGDAVVLALVSLPLFILDVWAWRRLLGKGPAVVLEADFLIDRSSLFAAGRVARTDIADVRVASQGIFGDLVKLELHQSARAKRLVQPAIGASMLEVGADYVASEIRRWLREEPRH